MLEFISRLEKLWSISKRLIKLITFWKKIYYAFVRDSIRIYQVLPHSLRMRYWFIFLLQVATALLESFTILFLSLFGLSLASPEYIRGHAFYKAIVLALPQFVQDRLLGDRSFIAATCLLVLVFIVVKNLTTWISMYHTTTFSEMLGLCINKETLERYFNKSYFWHISSSGGEIIARLGFRAQLTAMTTSIIQLYSYMLSSLVMFVMLFVMQPLLTLTVIVIFSSVSLAVYGFLRHRMDRTGNELARIATGETTLTTIGATGIREIIIYRLQKKFLEKIVSLTTAGVPHRAFMSYSSIIPLWLLEIAGFANIFGVLVFYIYLGWPMPQIIGAISMLMLTAWRVLPSVSRSMAMIVQIRGLRPLALSCLELLEGFINTEVEQRPEPDLHFHFKEKIELRDIRFRYPGTKDDCIKSLSVTIDKGESVAFIGLSGAGKSTVAMLIAGLFEPCAGNIYIDGVCASPQMMASFQRKVGFVPQNPLLLPGTVADNVALSEWGREYDREKVKAFCKYAAMDFVETNPNGIDMVIGDRGHGVSGGQAQRISIARALYSDPEVLIFDEATSALDQASENAINRTIQNLKGQMTMVIVAHRLSTVEHCDRIFWLEDGKLVDVGPPGVIIPRYVQTLEQRHMETNGQLQNNAID